MDNQAMPRTRRTPITLSSDSSLPGRVGLHKGHVYPLLLVRLALTWACGSFQDWDLIQVMDSEANATSFANLQGFFPPFTSKLTSGAYSSSQLMSGFAKAATNTQISPLNAKNWSTADATDAIIPTMMKALDRGANFQATVSQANTELQNVLNTGQES